MKAYCLYCKTGSELIVAKNINKVSKNFTAVAPTKILREKRKGIWEDKKQVLLPGYVFIYGENEINSTNKDYIFNAYKLLEYDTGQKELAGSDYEYAMWAYRHNGSIATSKVLAEGKSVKVIDGPLLDLSGKIVKLDKHKQKAWVEIEFYGEKKIISLSVDCITQLENN